MSDLGERLQRLLAPQTPDAELDKYEQLIARKYQKVSVSATYPMSLPSMHRMLIHTARHTRHSIRKEIEPNAERNYWTSELPSRRKRERTAYGCHIFFAKHFF